MNRWLTLAVMLVAPLSALSAEELCDPSIDSSTLTDDHYLFASPAVGAVGDVVPVEITLTVEELQGQLTGIVVVGCYDESMAELVGQPVYSSFWEQNAYASFFAPLGGSVGPQKPDGGAGFVFFSNLLRRSQDSFAGGEPVSLATLFFRLKGKADDAFDIRFCDNEFVYAHSGECVYNYLYYLHPGARQFTVSSTRHVPGQVRIRPGEATQPEPPVLPPEARVYPEPPSASDGMIHFELSGAAARPGDRQIPLQLYITSDYEFTSFSASVRFPPEHLELSRVEEHTRPGAVRVDEREGHAGIYLYDSHRRLAAEGERLRVATLYFDVKPEAAAVEEITPSFEGAKGFTNAVSVRVEDAGGTFDVPVTLQVEPFVVSSGLLKVQREATTLGDVDLDYTITMTDALALLGDLFLGAEAVLCPPASDFNQDEAVDLADAIGILRYLFLGASPPADVEVYCTP